MQITQGLHRALQLHPNAIASICEERTLTFKELKKRVSKLCSGLKSHGLQPDQPIAMLGLNSDYYLQYYLVCAWGNFLANPTNFRWNIEEIIYSLNDSNTQAIILDDNFAHHAENILSKCPSVKKCFYAGTTPENYPELESIETLINTNQESPDAHIGGDNTFGIFYTGGTTGFPKGVALSHKSLCTAALGFLAEGCFPSGCRGLHTAPMFHLADTLQTVCLLLRGGTHVMLANFSPENCLETIEKHAVTDILLVPTMLQMVVDSPNFSSFNISSLQRVYYGGSSFTEAAIDRALKALANVTISQAYGMTESSAFLTFLPWQAHLPENRDSGRIRSAGRPALHVQIKIVDEVGAEQPCGEKGEIIFKSPSMMQCYINKKAETEAAIINGWMHTGDVGYMDEEGYIYVIDRLKDMIISGGENVYCTEVENAISLHPSVASTAVIGIPSSEWGEAVHATVVLVDGATLTTEEIYKHCKQHIAGYKCPRSMSIVDQLPLTGAGKVRKLDLRNQLLASKNKSIQ